MPRRIALLEVMILVSMTVTSTDTINAPCVKSLLRNQGRDLQGPQEKTAIGPDMVRKLQLGSVDVAMH